MLKKSKIRVYFSRVFAIINVDNVFSTGKYVMENKWLGCDANASSMTSKTSNTIHVSSDLQSLVIEWHNNDTYCVSMLC